MVSSIPPHQSRILHTLLAAITTRAGWEWQGTHGWLLLSDFDFRPSFVTAESLASLARKGFSLRVDVRDPARRTPVWLHRLAPAGAQRIATPPTELTIPLPAGREDRHHRFYVPPGAAALLASLQALPVPTSTWLFARDLAALSSQHYSDTDLAWLESRSIIEKESVPSAARPHRPALRRRLTPFGLAVRPLLRASA